MLSKWATGWAKICRLFNCFCIKFKVFLLNCIQLSKKNDIFEFLIKFPFRKCILLLGYNNQIGSYDNFEFRENVQMLTTVWYRKKLHPVCKWHKLHQIATWLKHYYVPKWKQVICLQTYMQFDSLPYIVLKKYLRDMF